MKFFKLPLHKKLVLAETLFMLGIGRVTVLLFPFPAIKKKVENSISRQHKRDLGARMTDVEIIKWSVAIMSRYTPWKSNCYAQALAAQKMLSRRGIPSTLQFGLAREEDAMAAHAWLLYNDMVVTGEREMNRFKTIIQIGSLHNEGGCKYEGMEQAAIKRTGD